MLTIKLKHKEDFSAVSADTANIAVEEIDAAMAADTDAAVQSETSDAEPGGKETWKSPKKKPGRVSLRVTLLCIVLAAFLSFQVTFLALRAKYQNSLEQLRLENPELAKFEELDGILDSYFAGDLDKAAMLEAMLDAYVAASGDRYSEYYTVEEYAEVQATQSGETSGIGIIVSDGEIGLQILWVVEGSPAETAGLQIGDLIVAVDGNSYDSLGYNGSADALLGENGSRVALTVVRQEDETSDVMTEETLDISVTRGAYTSASVLPRLLSDGETGLVRILRFDQTTSDQFAAALTSLTEAGAQRLIFDVRDNPGGLLSSVVDVLDQLLPEGTVATLTNAKGETQNFTSDEKEVTLPMAVLCNKSTASAAELFTAALRDYQKAVIVGETTYGKGVAQTTYRLSDGSAVKMTTSRYDPPCGINYDGVGITPDFLVSLPEELKNMSLLAIPEESDTQLKAALSSLDA